MYIAIGKLNLKKGDTICFCGVWAFFQYLLILGGSYVLNRLGIRKSDISLYIYYAIYILLFLLSLRKMLQINQNLLRWILIYAAMVGGLLLGLILSPSSFKMDQSNFSLVRYLLFFPSVIFVYLNISDYKKLFEYLVIMARVLSLLCIAIFAVNIYRLGGGTVYDYDMVLGYQSILCAIILLLSTVRKTNIFDMLFGSISASFSLILGSRGAALVLLIFISFVFFKKFIEASFQKKLMLLCVDIILVSTVLINYYTIIKAVISALKNLNIESRTLEYLLKAQINDDNGRQYLYDRVFAAWEYMPITGYGLLGDRQFLSGKYVHNFFIEFITDFGFIFGVLFLIVIAYGLGKKIIKYSTCDVIPIVGIYTISSLMFSGSYVNAIHFYILLGMAFGYIHSTEEHITGMNTYSL